MLKRIVRNGLRSVGFDVVRYIKPAYGDVSLSGGNHWAGDLLLDAKLDIDLVIDVGVAGGTPSLYSMFPDAELILIEPIEQFLPIIKKTLGSRQYRLVNKAASANSGSVEMYIHPNRLNQSSMIKRSCHNDPGSIKQMVEMDTLDNMVSQEISPWALLKIDAEGSEVDVLKGATATLLKTRCVIVEVNMGFMLDESKNPLPEIDGILKSSGFSLFCLMDAVVSNSKFGRSVPKADFCYARL